MRIERDLARLTEPFDLIVIGGGITGVSVAREAAGRGLRTLLIEKDDFGGGTSAGTSKYIHGGIRYLETREFRVVRESLRERRVLALAAPHLVRQTRFLMPAWSWSKPSAPVIGAGMALYDALSFDRNRRAPESLRIPHPQWLRKKTLLAAVPWLDPDGLRGAFAYRDTFNLHPERLLLAFLKSAVQAGAVALNHMQANGFLTAPVGGNDIAVVGVQVEDVMSGEEFTVRGRAVVNAAGPWMDVVLRELGRPVGVSVQRSKGVHLLTRPLGGDDTVFARARSGKHVIVSPWQGYSFIGPTDTAVASEPDDVRVEHEDVREILDTVNSTLGPGIQHLGEDDIEGTTVGIRPLVVGDGIDSYHASRRHELYDHGQTGVSNLWSIGGGKWTTGRATGDETVKTLLRSNALRGVPTRKFDSTTVAAAGTFAWAEDAEGYLEQATRSRPRLPLAPPIRTHLARLYGTEHERILDLVEHDPSLGQRISTRGGRWDIAAQAVFAVTDEAARSLSDILDRRLVLGTLGRVTRDEIAAIAEVVSPLFGWSDGATSAAVDIELARRNALEERWRGRR